jgi:hypothetical protein
MTARNFGPSLAALSPEDRAVVKDPNIGAHLGAESGLKTNPKRYRFVCIDDGGRPPRDRTDDISRLVAALQSAPLDCLRGARGQLTAESCEDYLKQESPGTSRKTIRTAAKKFLEVYLLP